MAKACSRHITLKAPCRSCRSAPESSRSLVRSRLSYKNQHDVPPSILFCLLNLPGFSAAGARDSLRPRFAVCPSSPCIPHPYCARSVGMGKSGFLPRPRSSGCAPRHVQRRPTPLRRKADYASAPPVWPAACTSMPVRMSRMSLADCRSARSAMRFSLPSAPATAIWSEQRRNPRTDAAAGELGGYGARLRMNMSV